MPRGRFIIATWRSRIVRRSAFLDWHHSVNRSASGSLPGRAARQTQKGNADSKAAGAKHQLDETSHD